jgi:hypothetical protein
MRAQGVRSCVAGNGSDNLTLKFYGCTQKTRALISLSESLHYLCPSETLSRLAAQGNSLYILVLSPVPATLDQTRSDNTAQNPHRGPMQYIPMQKKSGTQILCGRHPRRTVSQTHPIFRAISQIRGDRREALRSWLGAVIRYHCISDPVQSLAVHRTGDAKP